MMADVSEIILQELRELRADYNNHARDTGERLAKLEAQMKTGITGNGQPSRLKVLEDAVNRLQAWRWWLVGASAATSTIAICLAWAFVHLGK